MDVITASTMQSLVDQSGVPSVSVYLPTHRFGKETQQDPIRLRNLLDQAERELIDTGMRPAEAHGFLEEGRALTADHTFWQHQEDGLALFIASDRCEIYRLPVACEPFVSVTDAFHVKPLWPAVGGDLFYILALSRNDIRLWWSDRFQIGDIDLPADIPTSLAKALRFDDTEKQLQHRASARAGRGRVIAQFHGHGAGDEQDVAKLEQFLRVVDDGIRTLIDPSAHLILAGVADIAARYRSVSRHPVIVDDILAGNPEDTSPDELREKATSVIQPILAKAVEADAADFLAADQLAVSDLPETVKAAAAGRVGMMFLPVGVQVWGRFDVDDYSVNIHDPKQPGDRDLLDLAGAATWSMGGVVHAVPADSVPGDGLVAATLRY